MYKQSSPYCIQIELTEGCNLQCPFCGIQGIREAGNSSPPYKFLTIEKADLIAQQIAQSGWNPRIEMAMHGEPTMNPNYSEIVKVFRNRLPKTHLQMTSNGGGFLKKPGIVENINEILKSGVNVLLLDNYDRIKICDKIRASYTGPYPVFEYPSNKEANPHKRRKPNNHHIVIVEDIDSATSGNHATLNNHAGSGFERNNKAYGKRCAKVFREISVRWDSNIAICCNDWRGEYKCGNMLETSIVDIWHGEEFSASRKKLYHGERDFGPCNGCDALSYRPGLLPDPKGKETLPKVTKEDYKAINKALDGQSYAEYVRRPWEKDPNYFRKWNKQSAAAEKSVLAKN